MAIIFLYYFILVLVKFYTILLKVGILGLEAKEVNEKKYFFAMTKQIEDLNKNLGKKLVIIIFCLLSSHFN